MVTYFHIKINIAHKVLFRQIKLIGMAEVDYSRFYYKRESEKNNKQPERWENADRGDSDSERFDGSERENIDVSRSVDARSFDVKPTRKNRAKRPFLVILTLIIIFGIVFFAADFFTGGRLIDGIAAGLRGNAYEYYFVVTETGGRDLAYAKSLLIKQMGGSGFILEENKKFLVALSVYTDKSEAAAVSDKNPNTYVHTLSFTSKNTEFFNAIDKAVNDFSATLKNLESGAPESDCYGALLSIKGEAVKMKAKILESGSKSELNLLDYIIGGIDGLEIGKGARLNFLSDARYVLCGIITSMCYASPDR